MTMVNIFNSSKIVRFNDKYVIKKSIVMGAHV